MYIDHVPGIRICTLGDYNKYSPYSGDYCGLFKILPQALQNKMIIATDRGAV